MAIMVPCTHCGGTGLDGDYACDWCEGGMVNKTRDQEDEKRDD